MGWQLRNRALASSAYGTPNPGASASIVPGVRVPPLWVEWWYYAQVFYAILGAAIGLSAGFVGISMLLLLAATSVLRMGGRFLAVALPLTLPLIFGATYLGVLMAVYSTSPIDENVRPVISWLLGLVAVQCLALRRGFLHRAAIALTLIGACALPFLTLYRGSGRFGLVSGIGIANPNDLSAWFGFSALYLAVVALEVRRTSVRLLAAMAAAGCVFVVVLTVSRGPLFALAVALLIAFRRAVNRGFFVLLPIVVIAWVVYGLGLFDQSASQYMDRGFSESGRLVVWPLALARFLESPLVGVGAAEVGTHVPGFWVPITPHNEFLYIALATGVVPLVFFVLYWIQLLRSALALHREKHEDAVLFMPLLAYVFLIGMQLNQPYMAPWAMIVCGAVSANWFVLKARASVVARQGRHRSVPFGRPAFVPARTKG
jgi:O-antigen ligase